jgi:hypothetical protein
MPNLNSFRKTFTIYTLTSLFHYLKHLVLLYSPNVIYVSWNVLKGALCVLTSNLASLLRGARLLQDLVAQAMLLFSS